MCTYMWMISIVLGINGLKTSLLICEGASTNLAAAKATHSHTGGAYDVQPG